MKALPLPVALTCLALAAACGKKQASDEGGAADSLRAPAVADSTIEHTVQQGLDADPRLDRPHVELVVHSRGGEVWLVGTVPTRREMQFAREVANSAYGVQDVVLDSLTVLSEHAGEAADTLHGKGATR